MGNTPRICGGGVKPPPPRKSRSTRWRALSLISVHILIALHIVHWLLTGETVSPVEPSESMYTLEQGQLNAGFLFFLVAILLTGVFGRFFCGWGCHVVALQDLLNAALRKVGIRPKPFRSRLLAMVPIAIAIYMFVWPSLKRSILIPALENWWPQAASFLGPIPRWSGFENHLLTTNFWQTFPSVAMAIPFLAICGFACVYLLGAKGFCTYGCPYGAFFAGADRLAPGRIVADLDSCEKCGHCSMTCTSNVNVAKEIQVYRQVVSPGCMKCLDCVSVCPKGALSFGWGIPKVLAEPLPKTRMPAHRYDLSLPEEVGIATLFLIAWFSWRGTYEQIPMLMATAMAICVSYLGWVLSRLIQKRPISLQKTVLLDASGWRPAGVGLALLTVALLLTTALAGFGRWNQWQANLGIARAETNLDAVFFPTDGVEVGESQRTAAVEARTHLEALRPVGGGGYALLPYKGTLLAERLGYMCAIGGDLAAARDYWESASVRNPSPDLWQRLGQLIALEDGTEATLQWLQERRQEVQRNIAETASSDLPLPHSRDLLRKLEHLENSVLSNWVATTEREARQAYQQGDPAGAARWLMRTAEWLPQEARVRQAIAELLEEAGDSEGAARWRRPIEE